MAWATYFEMDPEQLLGVRGLATGQVRLLLYSSERSSRRATHIHCSSSPTSELSPLFTSGALLRELGARLLPAMSVIWSSLFCPGSILPTRNAFGVRTAIEVAPIRL